MPRDKHQADAVGQPPIPALIHPSRAGSGSWRDGHRLAAQDLTGTGAIGKVMKGCAGPRSRRQGVNMERMSPLDAGFFFVEHANGAAPGMTKRVPDEVVTVIYRAHYAMLVRVAALLVGDVAAAEDVVQDSFLAMHRAWWRLRDTSKALPYLRSAVINKSRSVLRHRAVAERHPPMAAPEPPSAEDSALAVVQRTRVLAALGALSCRQ